MSLHRGRVGTFDDTTGLGTVDTADGPVPFHCTAIADGTRTIATGTTVTYRLVPGHRGRWEATDLTEA